MNLLEPLARPAGSLSAAARARIQSSPGEPLFIANWDRVLMLHLEVSGDDLQRVVPYELDLHEGRAFVSLVAFTMRGMRPYFGGRLAAWLFRPIATHDFLNVRTYVRSGGETGIYFMAEWLSNRLAVRLGPPTFSLPYRHGRIAYQHEWERGEMCGSVEDTATGARLRYHAEPLKRPQFAPCEPDSIDEWLMERYTAFNCINGRARFFRVWHPVWPQSRVETEIAERTLLARCWPVLAGAQLIGANFSPGVQEVWMGRPHRCRRESFRL